MTNKVSEPTTIKVLVLDDNGRAAKDSINRSLAPITIDSDRSTNTWQIGVGDSVFKIECAFEDNLGNARDLLNDDARVNQYHLVLLDNNWGVGTEGIDGLKLLQDMSQAGIRHPYLAIYTQAEGHKAEYVAEALKAGARALIWKSETTHFINVLLAAANDVKLKQEIAALSATVGNLQGRQEKFVDALVHVEPRLNTRSQAMKDCLVDAAIYAITPDIPVILVGPTGSGKEVLARAMHAVSPRKDKVFEVLNCTTITAELAESVLFGHEKGSFTGAVGPRQGIFEIADGGTLLIDEIDALSLSLQQKLLRVTESGEYRRVGGRALRSNCRLIVATNKDLYQQVSKSLFLPDLYQRLNYGTIRVPSLVERSEDIPDLAESFLKEFSERNLQQAIKINDEAKRVLQTHHWEFNIRELRATIFRSALKRTSEVIGPEDIVFDPLSHPTQRTSQRLTPSVVANIIVTRPRQGSQRKVLDLLLEKYPEEISYERLHSALGQPTDEHAASGTLMTIVSRLNKFLEVYKLKIESNRVSGGYRITQLDPD